MDKSLNESWSWRIRKNACIRASRDKGTVVRPEDGTRIRKEVHTFFPSLCVVCCGNVSLSTQREERLRRSGSRYGCVCVGGGGSQFQTSRKNLVSVTQFLFHGPEVSRLGNFIYYSTYCRYIKFT
jgi:hypothetical protein